MNGVQAEIRTGYLLKLSHLFNFVPLVIIAILQQYRSERHVITATYISQRRTAEVTH